MLKRSQLLAIARASDTPGPQPESKAGCRASNLSDYGPEKLLLAQRIVRALRAAASLSTYPHSCAVSYMATTFSVGISDWRLCVGPTK